MKCRTTCLFAIILLALLSLNGCSTDSTPTPIGPVISDQSSITPTVSTQVSTSPAATSSAVDAVAVTEPPTPNDNAPSPTEVTNVSTGGELTALQALAVLKLKAVAWQGDAQLGLLSNVRPGQQKNLLGDALGKPDINEPTPGGKGRNWTLVAFSPSSRGAMAFSMDGTQVDLVKEGTVTGDMLDSFTGTDTAAPVVARLDVAKIVDSDTIAQAAGERGKKTDMGVVLMAPDGLGVGPLPTPKAGGPAPQLAYELFTQDNGSQSFAFYDALTGVVVLDSAAP